MPLDLIFRKLKELDSQNKAIIILLSQISRKEQQRGNPLRAANTRQRITISRLRTRISSLQKEVKELNGFLNQETKALQIFNKRKAT